MLRIFKIGLRCFVICIISMLVGACAIMVAPTGGPKDTTPPVVVSFNPENRSVNFSQNTVKIKFNEFIELKNLDKELNIAPRLKYEPTIKLVGKNLIIKIKDTLQQNKTYNFNFGNAVVDFTEGNVLSDFQYIFSTGNFIDSFFLEGILVDAFTLKPMENCYVALYEQNIDSLPLTTVPDYVIKSKKDGSFRFNNMAKQKYKLFSLKDANASYTYDLPNEWLGFSDTLVESYYFSLKNIEKKSQSEKPTENDYFDTNTVKTPVKKPLVIRMFQERDTVQKLVKVNRMLPFGLQLFFKNPVDSIILTPLNRKLRHNWYITEYNASRDTVFCWLIKPGEDSLYLQVADKSTIFDTLELSMTTKATVSRGRGSGLLQRISFSYNAIHGGAKAFFEPLYLKANIPLDSCDFSKIVLKEDTLMVRPNISFSDNPVNRIIKIDYSWKQKKKYELLIPDSVAFHYSGITNDTVKLKFTVTALEDYGILLLNLQLPDSGNYILQILTSAGDVLTRRFIKTSGVQKFENIYPAKYSARLIVDENNNGKWDTGNYKKKIQPEKVFIYNGIIDIKANWDLEVDWFLKDAIK